MISRKKAPSLSSKYLGFIKIAGFSTLIILFVIAAGMIIISATSPKRFDIVQSAIRDVSVPVLNIISLPAHYFAKLTNNFKDFTEISSLKQQLSKLEEENIVLKQRLDLINRKYENIVAELGLIATTPRTHATVKVIADSLGVFEKTILLPVGKNQDIHDGMPILRNNSLIGRVISVGQNSSLVLLISDINSRIPVQIGVKNRHAILLGNNSNQLSFIMQNENDMPKAGETVTTSGFAGYLPPEIFIGKIINTKLGLRVKLASSLQNINYVTIMQNVETQADLNQTTD